MTYQEQIATIVAKIALVLKPSFDPETYAVGMLEEADDNQRHFEVRGSHTQSGAPHTFCIA